MDKSQKKEWWKGTDSNFEIDSKILRIAEGQLNRGGKTILLQGEQISQLEESAICQPSKELAKKVREKPPQTFENLISSVQQLQNVEDSKMLIFPDNSSHSSEEQITPIYLPIVEIASDNSEVIEFYVPAKMQKNMLNSKLKWELQIRNIIGQIKKQTKHQIRLFQEFGCCIVFKVKISSDIRGIHIRLKNGDIDHVSNLIRYKRNMKFALGNELSFDFRKEQKLESNILEEIIILTFLQLQKGDNDERKKLIESEKDSIRKSPMKVGEQIQNLIQASFDMKMFCDFILEVINSEHYDEKLEHLYDVVAKMNTENIFRGTDQATLKIMWMYYELIVKGKVRPVEIKKICAYMHQQSLSTELQSLLKKQIETRDLYEHSLIKSAYEFLDDFINKVVRNMKQEDLGMCQQLEVLVLYYFIDTEGPNKNKLVEKFVSALTPSPTNQSFTNIIRHMKTILQYPEFSLNSVSSSTLYKLFQLFFCYPQKIRELFPRKKMIDRLNQLINKSSLEIDIDIFKIISLLIKQKEVLQFQSSIDDLSGSILRCISRRNDNINELKKFNEYIVLDLFQHRSYSEVLNKYKKLIRQIFKLSDKLIILSAGLSEETQSGWQKGINLILTDIQRGFRYKSDPKWHHNFMFHQYINQKVLDWALDIIEQKPQIQREEQYQEINELIEKYAKKEQINILKALIIFRQLEITQQKIFQIITQQKEKLQILLLLKQRENRKSKKLQGCLQKIKKRIQDKNYSYLKMRNLNQIIQQSPAKLTKLFGETILQKIQKSLMSIKPFISRVNSLRHFLKILKEMYKANLKSCEQKENYIQQTEKQISSVLISELNIKAILPQIKDEILVLYPYSFFYQGYSIKGKKVEDIIQISNIKLEDFRRNGIQLLKGIKNNKVQYYNYSYFDFENIPLEKVKDLFANKYFNFNQAEVDSLVKIILKHEMFIEYNNIAKALKYFVEIDESENPPRDIMNALQKIIECSRQMKKPYKEVKEVPLKKAEECQLLFSEIFMKNFQIKLNQDIHIKVKEYLDKGKVSVRDESDYVVIQLVILWKNVQTLEKMKLLIRDIEEIKTKYRENNQDTTLKISDFSTFQSVMKDFSANLDNLKSIKKRIKNLKSRKQYQRNNLIEMIKKYEQFEMFGKKIQDPHYLQSISIAKIIENSRLLIQIDHQKYTFQLKIKSRIVGVDKEITKLKLKLYQDEAYIKIKKLQGLVDTQSLQEIQKNKKFLKLFKKINEIEQIEKNLLSYGYFYFKKFQEKISIQKGSTGDLQQYLKLRENKYFEWKEKIEQLYNINEKITMLRGKKLKQFFQFLLDKSNGNLEQYRHIVGGQWVKKARQQKFSYQRGDSQIKCLQLLKQFFSNVKVWQEKKGVITEAKDQCFTYVDIFKFSEDDKDYIFSISQIDEDKVKNLNEGSVLLCNENTSVEQIESLIHRTRNTNQQFFIFGYQRLSTHKQTIIIDKLEQLIKQKKKIKICLVGNSSTQKLYSYFVKKVIPIKTKRQGILDMKGKNLEGYKKFIEERLGLTKKSRFGKVKIYSSQYSGLGKSTRIQSEVNSHKKQSQFFPISGKISAQQIYDRLEKINKNKKINGQTALIIQLYNIESKEIVNDFLTQIILWRSFNFQSQFCIFSQGTPIFIEIQNTSYPKDKEVILPFLKQVQSLFKKQIHVQIKKIQGIEIAETNQELLYILEHLSLFQNKKLDSSQMTSFKKFKPANINYQIYEALLEKYFFKKLMNPSFHLFQTWTKIFFCSCHVYSKCFQLKISTLRSSYSQRDQQQYKIGTLRSQFFNILYKNSLQFIIQNSQQDQNRKQMVQNSKLVQKIRKFPFFVIPQFDKEWFCFLYRNIDDIPNPVKFFMISQDPKWLEKRRNNQKISIESEEVKNDILIKQHALMHLEANQPKKFQDKLSTIMQDISGNKIYSVTSDQKYVITLDNFFKMCLIAFKMIVSIPIIIEGEAGIGKTALLRHVVENVFGYQFLVFNINPGTTQRQLEKNIKTIEEKKAEKGNNKKICAFFDEFNTMPSLGYVSQILIQRSFLGSRQKFLKDIIPIGACNPYRMKNNARAYLVYHIPGSMRDYKWNFGFLESIEMKKYIHHMLSNISLDMDERIITTITELHFEIQKIKGIGSSSLRSIEQIRQLYSWFKANIPTENKLPLPQDIQDIYQEKSVRSFCCSMMMTFFLQNDSQTKRNNLLNIIEKNCTINAKKIKEIKQFEEDDFCSRLQINERGIALNRPLKENIFTSFVSMMTKIPLIIIGKPGNSKSLAVRLLLQNLQQKTKHPWLNKFPKISDYPFQGSETCQSKSIENLFQNAQNSVGQKNKIPVIIFDQIGLAEKSKYNPLKVLHRYLEAVEFQKNDKIVRMVERKLGFIGISNDPLDTSKMSRFLILCRSDIEKQDLEITANSIARGILRQSDLYGAIISELRQFSAAFESFINQHNQKNKRNKCFFGLRDFYNLVKTFTHQLSKNKIKGCQTEKIQLQAQRAIFRNFNGQENSVAIFNQFFKRSVAQNENKFSILKQIKNSLTSEGKRFPLIIVQNKISGSMFEAIIKAEFKSCQFFCGSPFKNDLSNQTYISKSVTSITRVTERKVILLASNLNRTIETTLFDLFNKFFYSQRGQLTYKIARPSGLILSQVINPEFNCAVILQKKQLAQVSSAFLSRFEKYQFSLDNIGDEKYESIKKGIQSKLFCTLKEYFNESGLNHYQRKNLFINMSESSLKTLISKKINTMNDAQNQKIILQCCKTICLLASRDYQLIVKNFICDSQNEELKEIYDFSIDAFSEKKKIISNSNCIIYASQKSVWQIKQSKRLILQYEFIKNEEQLEQEIQMFFDNKQKEEFILTIKEDYVYSADDSAPVGYLIQKFEEGRKKSFMKMNTQEKTKLCKIVLEYDRRKQIYPISFYSFYEQVADDGIEKTKEKLQGEDIFQNIKMSSLIEQASKCLSFKYDESLIAQILQYPSYFEKMLQQEIFIENSEFVLCCKKAITTLEGNTKLEMNKAQLKSILKKEQNLKEQRNLDIVLTKNHFIQKTEGPLAYFLQISLKTQLLQCFSMAARALIFEKMINFPDKTKDESFSLKKEDQLLLKDIKKSILQKRTRAEKFQYDNLKRIKRLPTPQKKKEVQIKRAYFFPYAHKQIEFIFGAKTQQKAKQLSEIDQDDFQRKLREFITFYEDKTQYNSQNDKENYMKIKNSKCLTRLLFLDILIAFLEKNSLPIIDAIRFERQFSFFINDDYDCLPYRVALLLSYSLTWISIFKILASFYSQGINISLKTCCQETKQKGFQSFKEKIRILLQKIVELIQTKVSFTKTGSSVCKGWKNLVVLFQQCFQEIDNFRNSRLITVVQESFQIERQFILFWGILNEAFPHLSLEQYLSRQQIKTEEKIFKIFSFLKSVIKKEPKTIEMISQYEANNLFYYWLGNRDQKGVNEFLKLCDKNFDFAHHTVRTLNLLVKRFTFQQTKSLEKNQIAYKDKIKQNLCKIFMQIMQECQKNHYQNNISILLVNLCYNKFQLSKKDKVNLTKFQNECHFLQQRWPDFKFAMNLMNSENISSFFHFYVIGFLKLYIESYIQSHIEILQKRAQRTSQIMKKIDRQLCVKTPFTQNLRFYCLKLLRKQLTVKEIYDQLFKMTTIQWTETFKDFVKQQKSRAIHVPNKIQQNSPIDEHMKQIIGSDGKDFHQIESIVKLSTQSRENKYKMLSFFMNFLYSQSYNTQSYKNSLIEEIEKEQKYKEWLKPEEYKLLLKYTKGNFDQNLSVGSYETFDEDHLIIFNSFNLLLSSKNSQSPLHSLFFKNGERVASIVDEIDKSFLPIGAQNPFINIAKTIYGETRNNNIGVYICSDNCDYIYSHGNCGWPGDSHACPVCKQKIGGRGHRLQRQEKGARRLMTNKFVDNWNFYVGAFKTYDCFWDTQRLYIQKEMNRMMQKQKVTQKEKNQSKKLIGYNLEVHNDRISMTSSRIIALCLESIIYCWISLDQIPEVEAKRLISLDSKAQILRVLYHNIRQYIKEIKSVAALNENFYGWIFGIQKLIFNILTNFQDKYHDYVLQLKQRERNISQKISEVIPQVNQERKVMFQDLKHVVDSGIVSKNFQDAYENKRFTARHAFSRTIFEILAEREIEKNIHKCKLDFAKDHNFIQGKMQFPCDTYLTESEVENRFYYCQIFNVPSKIQSLERILDKYEATLKQKYPYLEYMIRNTDSLQKLSYFNQVVLFINKLVKVVNYRFTRKQCEQKSLRSILNDLRMGGIEEGHITTFIKSWKELNKYVGVIQVDCKVYGKMNEQLNSTSPIISFLVQNRIKQNPFGKIVTGIFNNLAVAHNQTIGILNTRKNASSKYRKKNLILQKKKIILNEVSQNEVFTFDEEKIRKNFKHSSTSSIKYGERILYHNFDFCEAEELKNLQGKCEFEPSIEKIESVEFIGEAFSTKSPYSNAIGELRQKIQADYTELSEKQKKQLILKIKEENQIDLLKSKGILERVIIQLYKTQYFNFKENLENFLNEQSINLGLTRLLDDFAHFPLSKIVNFYQVFELQLYEITFRDIRSCYRDQIEGRVYKQLSEFFDELPIEEQLDKPSIKEFREAVCRFGFRNLLLQSYGPGEEDEGEQGEGQKITQKLMEFVQAKEDFWPKDYDIQTKIFYCFNCQALQELTINYTADFISLLNKIYHRKSRE